MLEDFIVRVLFIDERFAKIRDQNPKVCREVGVYVRVKVSSNVGSFIERSLKSHYEASYPRIFAKSRNRNVSGVVFVSFSVCMSDFLRNMESTFRRGKVSPNFFY